MSLKNLLLYLSIILAHTALKAQSVLSSGNWYKVGVTESKVYKLDYDFLEKTLGINTSKIDPRTIKVYGNGGGMLPQPNSIYRPNDPVENAIFGVGESDGKFDKTDYFLFHGQSPHLTQLQPDGTLLYEGHDYCDTAYFFITYGENNGLRLSNKENLATTTNVITTFRDYIVYEENEEKHFESGREWYSKPLKSRGDDQVFRIFEYDLPGIKDSIGINLKLLAHTENPAAFEIAFNDNIIGQIPVAAIRTYKYSDRAFEYPFFHSAKNNTSQTIKLKIDFKENISGDVNSRGYFDYFVLGFDRSLKLYGDQTSFRSTKNLNTNRTFRIEKEGSATLDIWNITNPKNPAKQQYATSGNTLTFTEANTGAMTEYIVFDLSKVSAPNAFGKVSNQNIKTKINVDAIIISAPEFLTQAHRLADFHQSHDGLSVAVVTPRQVYNEFSSGTQDVTAIRDYLRYVWLNGNKQLKYALLFGDGSYDYKYHATYLRNKKQYSNQNFVPVYQSQESINRLYSHSSDDYYAFFEEDEGDWYEGDQDSSGRPKPGTYNDHTQEIGVGRIPSKNLAEARNVVDKIIRYATSPNTLGAWRNELTYLVDDGDGNTHMRDSEKLAEIISNDYPEYNVTRLYLDNFEQPNNTSPSMEKALMEKFNDGIFLLDYLGHGRDDAITQELVFDTASIAKLNNRHRLPLIVTATCNFGVYDDPQIVSGAERALLHPNGGAIALLTTTRAVFANTNYPVNAALHNHIFSLDENGQHLRLGDVMRLTKNNSLAGPINRNFALLGDPMLTLNYPAYKIAFDELDQKRDTLSALEKVTINGKVHQGGALISNFNGTATITVWDAPREKRTLGLDNPATSGLEKEINYPFDYQEQDNALFRGDATVKNGTFSIDFILPKNASYKFKQGRISAYAIANSGNMDANGASSNFVIGGSAELQEDTTPPVVSIYLNEPTFKNGDIVGPSSLFIASLSDANGINVSTNGFNQNLMLTLNDTIELILNNYYTASADDYTKGKVVFPLQNLAPGSYHGELKVWDVYNNYSLKSVDFKVSDEPKIRLFKVMNYPNPISASGETTFSFEHDRIGEGLKVNVMIYDMEGGKVREWDYKLDDTLTEKVDVPMTIESTGGQPLRSGVYFYKLQVTSTSDGATNQIVNRLLIKN